MKKYLLGGAAAMLALALSLNVTAKRAPQDFHYNPALGADQTNPNNYDLGVVSCDGITSIICNIKAEKSGSNKPIFTAGTNPVTNPSIYQAQYRSN